MLDYFFTLNPVVQALIAGLFTWGCTIFGASFVFLLKTVNQKILNVMMGAAAGVMIAASFWSLLAPSLEYAEPSYGKYSFFPAAVGFLAGGLFIRLIDFFTPHLHLNQPIEAAEGIAPEKLSKTALLFLAITIHNIPEGLAVGVAFGAIATNVTGVEPHLMGAVGLAIGIGLQNIPEGAALSLPIRGEGHSNKKAFWYGTMSAVVEPIAAVIGAFFVISMTSILPYALAFAAGAMIFVVVEELIPESQCGGDTDMPTLGLMLGFTIMMILDVALG